MATKYRVVGPFPAYGVRQGDTVMLDETDPLVQVNVGAGLIEVATDTNRAAAPDAQMTCPLCVEREDPKPAVVKSQDELAAHYAEAHAAFRVPAYNPMVPQTDSKEE